MSINVLDKKRVVLIADRSCYRVVFRAELNCTNTETWQTGEPEV